MSKKIVFSSILTGLLLAVLWHICPIMFQNNDDKFLLYMMAGYTTGKPSLYTVFGGFLWAGFIALFYKLNSGIAWYTIITLVAIVLSLVIICGAYLQSSRKVGLLCNTLIYISLFFVSLCYFASALQYTMTSAYVGVAGVCAIMLAEWADSHRIKLTYIVISAVCIAAAYSIRKEMGLVTMSCVFIILFFMVLKTDKAFAIKSGVIIFATFVVVFASNHIYEKYTGLVKFNEDYSIIQRWIDYPHIDINDDVDGVYASVGWDQELYDAANEWFFIDERVTPENIQVINDASDAMSVSMTERMVRAKDALANKQMVNVQVLLWLTVLVLSNVSLIRKREGKDDLLAILCADCLFLFFVALAIYFCVLQGRFPLRVYQALVIIYSIPSMAMMFKVLDKYKCDIIIGLITFVFVVAVPLCYRCFPSGSMIYQGRLATHDVDRQNYIATVTQLEEYAAEHKDNIYVYDYELSQPSAPFVTFTESMPYNILYWGGWTYGSPVYCDQLRANGLEELRPKDLIGGNIYLCGKSIDQTIYKYMERVFGEIHTEVVDKTGDVIIYRYCY